MDLIYHINILHSLIQVPLKVTKITKIDFFIKLTMTSEATEGHIMSKSSLFLDIILMYANIIIDFDVNISFH